MSVHFREHSKILGYLAHTQLAKSLLIQGLSENIGQLIFSSCMADGDIALQHMITKKMMTNLDVFCLRVLNWVMSNLDGTLIVAVERHILHVDAIVLECLLHP